MAAALAPIELEPLEIVENDNCGDCLVSFFMKYLDSFFIEIKRAYTLDKFPGFTAIVTGINNFQKLTRTVVEDDPKKEDLRRYSLHRYIVEDFVERFTKNTQLFAAALGHDFAAAYSAIPEDFSTKYGLRFLKPFLEPNKDLIFQYTDVLFAASLNYAIVGGFPKPIMKRMASIMGMVKSGVSAPSEVPEEIRGALGMMKALLPAEASEVMDSVGSEIMAMAADFAMSPEGSNPTQLMSVIQLMPNVSSYAEWAKSVGTDHKFVVQMQRIWELVD